MSLYGRMLFISFLFVPHAQMIHAAKIFDIFELNVRGKNTLPSGARRKSMRKSSV